MIIEVINTKEDREDKITIISMKNFKLNRKFNSKMPNNRIFKNNKKISHHHLQF